MRIVAGRHRGRRLEAPPGPAVRPTSDRAREAVFDILAHGKLGGGRSPIADAVVLDAFAGSGALGLEALSRGAAAVTLMDRDKAACRAARANVAALGEKGRATVLHADSLRPPPAPRPATLVFLDPPYGEGLAATALEALAEAGWIEGGAIVVVELGRRDPFQAPQGFEAIDERRYGRARILFLRRSRAGAD
jgi:16S rRNA (guanine966-N2)-methyltransferase